MMARRGTTGTTQFCGIFPTQEGYPALGLGIHAVTGGLPLRGGVAEVLDLPYHWLEDGRYTCRYALRRLVFCDPMS